MFFEKIIRNMTKMKLSKNKIAKDENCVMKNQFLCQMTKNIQNK